MSPYLTDLVERAAGRRVPLVRPRHRPRIYAPVGPVAVDSAPDRAVLPRPMMEAPKRPPASPPTARVARPTSIEPAASTWHEAAQDTGPRLPRRGPGDDIAADRPVVHTESLRETVERIVAPRPPPPRPAAVQPPAAKSLPQQVGQNSSVPVREIAERPRRQPAEEPVFDTAPVTNIHIGRVELTAIAPPPTRRAPGAPVKPPMSLEEYLRRRDGRA